jgi:HEAT repeat protein
MKVLLAFFCLSVLQGLQEEIKSLVRDLGSANFKVRERAQHKLIGMGSKVLKYLKKMENSKDPEIRWRIKEIVMIIPVKERLPRRLWRRAPEAVKALACKKFNVRFKVFENLILTEPSRGFLYRPRVSEIEPILMEVIRDDVKPRKKIEVVSMLADSKIKGTDKILLGMLTHKMRVVREGASRAICKMRPYNFERYVEAFLRDKNPSVRVIAVKTLGGLRSRRSIYKLVKLLSDPSKSVRKNTLKVLLELDARKSVKRMLIKLLAHRDPNIRFDAIAGIGKFEIKEAKGKLIKMLNDKVPRVRAKTLDTLTIFGIKEAIKPIRRLLRKERIFYVRRKAVLALRVLKLLKK